MARTIYNPNFKKVGGGTQHIPYEEYQGMQEVRRKLREERQA